MMEPPGVVERSRFNNGVFAPVERDFRPQRPRPVKALRRAVRAVINQNGGKRYLFVFRGLHQLRRRFNADVFDVYGRSRLPAPAVALRVTRPNDGMN